MDEKSIDRTRHRNGPSTYVVQRSRRSRWLVPLVALLIIWTLRRDGTWYPLNSRPKACSAEIDWRDIPTKPELEYYPCYGEYQCTKLELPMDYWNGTTNATISLAVVRQPAAVPVDHPQYGGPILLNPGGPGGSGIGLLLGAGRHISAVLDDSDGKYFDLISFDPRGIGLTEPGVHCTTELVAAAWRIRTMQEGLFSSSDAAFGRLWSMAHAQGKSCSRFGIFNDRPDIKKYVSTAYVARDMLELVERHGQWREKETKKLALKRSSRSGRATVVSEETPELLKYKPGKEKIQYLGFSYGTYLGNTFAAMFPDRIDRLVVDGVVDAYDYKKALWLDNLVDTEKDLDLFFYHCARVGYPTCALANTTGTTTSDGVRNRTLKIIDSLYHNPLPIISPEPLILTYSDVKDIIFASLYSPIQAFPFVANLLADIENGTVSVEVAELLKIYYSLPDSDQDSGVIADFLRNTTSTALSQDAGLAIACSDGDDQSWVSQQEFFKHIKNIVKEAPTIGELWATLRLRCIPYSVRAVHRFEGPWIGNTSHPILEIGNTADPVTPGRYAKKMAKGFPGAGVLIQDSAGHCSLSTPSNCTETYVHRYFQTGELPPEGTICKADAMPFGPDENDAVEHNDRIAEVQQRQQGLAKAFHAAGGGFAMPGAAGRLRVMPWA